MKRLTLILIAILTLAVGSAVLWGNQFIASTVDARLPPLLTEKLGLPVSLAPSRAYAFSLRVQSDRLVMGDPEDPAVVATDVEVRLSWPELLKGSVRIVFAEADDLMVKPSRWPSSGEPLPDNYRFLDPWLPRKLRFNTGRYVLEDGFEYPVQSADWTHRILGGVKLSWNEQRKGGLAELDAELDSLQDLLDLTDFQLTLEGEIDDVDDSAFVLALHIRPGAREPYFLKATVEAIDTRLSTEASGSQRWTWPDTSHSHYDKLDLGALGSFLNLYRFPGDEDTAESFLATQLPALTLIPHTGQLSIEAFSLAGETVQNTELSFAADYHGLRVDPLSMEGPRATVNGSVIIDSSEKGWDFALDTRLHAREGGSIGQAFLDTQWRWEDGNSQLKGHGTTWGELMYSLEGHVAMSGHYHGQNITPVAIDAVLASTPGEFSFDQLEVSLGEGRFHGDAKLSGSEQRKLTIDLTGDRLDLDFLFAGDEDLSRPGVAIPEYLNVLPSLDLDWTLKVSDLNAPGLQLASADAHFQRNDLRGSVVANAIGNTGGTLKLKLSADYPDGVNTDFQLQSTFNRFDLPGMFEQPNLLHSRSSGSLNLEARGKEMQEIFADMRGSTKLAVEIRPDNNWKREALDTETLELTGASRFVIDGPDIVGIELSELDLDSTEQDLTGTLSMVVTRTPWLIADLHSDMMDVNGLLELLPESTEEAEQIGFLQTLRNLGAAQINLQVASLTVGEAPISRLNLELHSDTDLLKIREALFFTHGSRIEGNGTLSWEGSLAKIEMNTRLTDVDLDQFLIRDPEQQHVPVDGSAQLSSEGKDVEALIGNLTGHIDLKSAALHPDTGQPQRQFLMYARRLEGGVEADVKQLRLAENHLTGTIRYLRGTPPQLDVNLTGGSFSLEPWETRHVEEDENDAKKKSSEPESGIRRVASSSASAVGRVLRAPLRMLEASEDNRDKTRFFSDEPLPLDALNKVNANIRGRLDALKSSIANLYQLSFDGTLENGKLDITARTEKLNGGQAKVDLKLDSNAVPPTVSLRSDFNEVRGITQVDTYTRSGFIAAEAQGNSPAALAASLDGLIYLELGPGPFDYQNMTLLSTGLATRVFTTLLPGIEREAPKLECGVTVAEFTDGKGVTPYGYAVRTNQANLLGHLELDLAKEKMQLNFESRSREGVGLSVGNVISNSVQVRGSFTDPHIVPRATSIAWRGWAAFMTAGLSVVAESVLKRAMASENPCPPIKTLISKEMCPKSEIAASSPRMCPQGQVAQAE